MRLPQE
jgi:hypothetical protein